MQDWLVHTKLQPPLLRADTIPRDQLLEMLRNAVSTRPVTLISAPAGYGKTTLLAHLPRLLPDLPVAWLSLDGDDNDPARFLGALVAALQRLHPAVGELTRQHLTSEPRRVLGLLINEMMEHLPGPFALVLDDLHFVTDARVYAGLDFLMERLPPQMRLVIATRHDPPLALARLIARRQVAEVRRPQLSFTSAEVHRLLNETLGLALDAEALAALTARTEGWAAGLCLLASSLDRITTDAGRSALLTGLAQTDQYVFDYLAAEVLAHQEPETRTFLLQTAILADLTPALCEAVTGRPDAGRVLEALYRKNLFLVVDESGAYRYHALFAEFLRRQLAEEQSEQVVAELHRRAALAQSSPARAIHHYLAGGHFEEAACAIEQAGEHLFLMGMVETLTAWGRQLPDAVKERHPQLALTLGRALIAQSDYPGAYAMVDQAREGFLRIGNAMGGHIALTILCSCAMLMGDVPTCRALAAEFGTVPNLPKPLRARDLAVLIYLHAMDQRWDEAVAALGESLALTIEVGDLSAVSQIGSRFGPWVAVMPGGLEPLEAFCRWAESAVPRESAGLRLVLLDNILPITELMRGRPEKAAAAAEEALAIKERIGGYTYLGLSSAMCLATVAGVRGDRAAAAAHVETLLRYTETAQPDQMQLWLYAAGRTNWLLGNEADARRLLARMQDPVTPKGFTGLGPALQRRLAGLLALGGGRPAEAEGLFREAVAMEQACPVALSAGSGRVLLVRALMDQHRTQEALAELRALLAVCAERSMPGLIYQEGALIRPLLHQAAHGGGPGSEMAAYVLTLLGDAPAVEVAVRAVAPGLAEPLTERELEVLRLLAAGVTNREIARALIVGEETVKTHVARILRKLDVGTRGEAAARGRALGLV